MAEPMWHPDRSRKIRKRIIVTGDLILQTPGALGNGDQDDQVDLPLLTDALEPERPLLTGASLAGGMRAYLKDFDADAAIRLFGAERTDNEGIQSPLIVDDALGRGQEIEIREGVALSPKSRTAQENALYSRELWAAGTTFPLRVELLVTQEADEDTLRRALATALHGFEAEAIPLGARKTRGYGRAKVGTWKVRSYDLTDTEGLKSWLRGEDAPQTKTGKIGVTLSEPLDGGRSRFTMEAIFSLDGSLLIRTAGDADPAPDMVHLRARQPNGEKAPILSGSSLAGALRARATKIANTLGKDGTAAAEMLFGPLGNSGKPLKASRVCVSERAIEKVTDSLVQFRVSIDRFTGGARDAFLFNQQPVFGDDTSRVTFEIELAQPREAEIGLLLLLLKDLWTGSLLIGGEASVGRGRLKGIEARIAYNQKHWCLEAVGERLEKLQFSGDPQDELEKYVKEYTAS